MMAGLSSMAKKGQALSPQRLPILILIVLLAGGGWWIWQSPALANWKDQLFHYVDNRDIITLEARFLPEQIAETHRQELLGSDNKRTLQNTVLKYYPYLLLEVKYPDQSRTREGILLWGLNDGEMVLHTETWETTHGFRDCLECQATRADFKILYALARRQTPMPIEELQKELHVERETLNSWIEGAKKKHLILQKGSLLQLHFENPKLLVTPQTRMNQPLVSKPRGEGQKVPRNYSRNQILEMTQAAFGSDFNIRHEQEIFLPVYRLEILNPDGSIKVSEWNALTGQRIFSDSLSKRAF